MEKVEHAVGTLIAEVLTLCYAEGEHRQAIEGAAALRSVSAEQLVAAAIARRLSEKFVMRPMDQCGPTRGRRKERA
jgi:hypothetical protein